MTPTPTMLILILTTMLSLPHIAKGMDVNGNPQANFLITLPEEILYTIIAQLTHRTALCTTCAGFHKLANTDNIIRIVSNDRFRGSPEDIIKACEACIETRDTSALQAISAKHGSSFWFQPNIIGRSLYEYATRAGIPMPDVAKNENDMLLDDDIALTIDHADQIGELYTSLVDQIYTNKLYPQNTPALIQRLQREFQASPQAIDPTIIVATAVYNRDHELLSNIMPMIRTVRAYTCLSPLEIACMRGSPACVDLLLKYGMNPFEAQYNNTTSAIEQAAHRGFTHCVLRILMSRTCKIPDTIYERLSTYADKTGYKELLELLHNTHAPYMTTTVV